MKKIGAVILGLLLLLPAAPARGEEQISAKGAALLEAGSGRLLYGKNEQTQLPMASTTKIMTALLALERGDINEVVTVGKEAQGTEGSSLYLSAEEQMSLKDLLYGLLMASGNDAAVAIAVHIAGSVEAFAELMNQRAASLGCHDTHFVNPNGLPDPAHYTTALDLARIAAEAMRNPVFREMVNTQQYTTTTGGHSRTFYTKNKVLTQIEGGCGVKTGYTKKAGRCLCFAAEREGMLLIGVVLNAPNMWKDAETLLSDGFSQYALVPLIQGDQPVAEAAVSNSEKKALPVAAKEDILYPIRKDGSESVQTEISLPEELPAPVLSGVEAGEARLYVNGVCLYTVPLYTQEEAPKRTWEGFFIRCIEGYLAA